MAHIKKKRKTDVRSFQNIRFQVFLVWQVNCRFRLWLCLFLFLARTSANCRILHFSCLHACL